MLCFFPSLDYIKSPEKLSLSYKETHRMIKKYSGKSGAGLGKIVSKTKRLKPVRDFFWCLHVFCHLGAIWPLRLYNVHGVHRTLFQ